MPNPTTEGDLAGAREVVDGHDVISPLWNISDWPSMKSALAESIARYGADRFDEGMRRAAGKIASMTYCGEPAGAFFAEVILAEIGAP